MNNFDTFCATLLEQSKRFLEKSKEETSADGQKAYQHACLFLAVCSLEAYINGIAEEMSLWQNVQPHIKAFLLEKELRLEKGEFVLSDSLKMSRLSERIEVLYVKYNKKELDKSVGWWNNLQIGISLRNKITHPTEEIKLTNEVLAKVLQAVIDCLSSLYKAVYKRNFPKANLSLISKFDF